MSARLRIPLERNSISSSNRFARLLWSAVWNLLYRPSPIVFHGWRRALLRLFGASIGSGAHPYPSARIWAPWNLTMGENSCLGSFVDCYCVDRVELGANATVSQYCYICTASRDINLESRPLITAPIRIGARAWLAADVFVGPGVSIGDRAVVGARSTVLQNIPADAVAAGNPAALIRSGVAHER